MGDGNINLGQFSGRAAKSNTNRPSLFYPLREASPCLSHVGLWMIQTLQHDSGGVFYFPQPPTDLHLISTDLADLIHPYRSASFGERQLGAILIAPTALTVHGGLPARRHSVQ